MKPRAGIHCLKIGFLECHQDCALKKRRCDPEYFAKFKSYHSIKLLTLNWCVVVIKLLRDEAAETQNPYAILKLYYRGWFMWLGFLINAFLFEYQSKT